MRMESIILFLINKVGYVIVRWQNRKIRKTKKKLDNQNNELTSLRVKKKHPLNLNNFLKFNDYILKFFEMIAKCNGV